MSVLSFPVPPPNNGDDLNASVVTQDLNYLLQNLQSLDLSNAIPGSALDTLFNTTNSPLQRFMDGFQSFVVSGGLPSGFTLLSYTVPAIIGATFKSNGKRVASIAGQTYTAAINSDTYISCESTGVINTPQAVANGASAPALPAADCQWLCKIISNGTTITSIVDLRNLFPVTSANIQIPYKFSVYQSGDFSVSSGVWTKATLNFKLLDTNNNFDSTTNYRFTVPIGGAGFYQLSGQVGLSLAGTGATGSMGAIYKNGSALVTSTLLVGSGTGTTIHRPIITAPLTWLNVGDYIELYGQLNEGSRSIQGAYTWLSGYLVSAN